MIGSGLKKLAVEYGLKVDKGVAYGAMQGYAVTMSEGAGWKEIIFAVGFADPAQREAFMQAVNQVNVQKAYRVRRMSMAPNAIQVLFNDTVGTMKKIRAFLEWFLPLLQQYQATAWNVCPECGMEVVTGKWMLIENVAYYMHESCAQKTIRDIQGDNERRVQEDTGSYARGAIGAVVGAALGGVAWALVLMMGYVASIMGLLVGWLSDAGYRLLKGKNGKGKIAILIVSVIFGVVAGTIGADIIMLIQMVGRGELPGMVAGDVPALIFVMLAEDPEYRGIVLKNIGMGLLFAALGVYWLVVRTKKEVSGTQITELK
jgi:hypothetical protein